MLSAPSYITGTDPILSRRAGIQQGVDGVVAFPQTGDRGDAEIAVEIGFSWI
jgi:hypothetical protein